ncbi:DUF1906 domain-containing protein [Microbacterium paludicola]|uniref:DUF1906 domain-containing protein n=1 Tax=Microbacterium paludicola TaxID=300019 RepID=A0A4Y9FR91_9MICO|nr:glycoside hydrolase domain-containing protein [Microbacterium paludicola]MBF0817475.1 DUF1906 domain-containing protein [Microbacterium paludicola]TFU31023.1 DUF1906 domain-containing protein [Microbacterium paludicola]
MSDPWVSGVQHWYNETYSDTLGVELSVDGATGWATMYALTRALQYELGISPQVDNFGSGTLSALTTFGSLNTTNPPASAQPSNIVKLAQAALYCKGYNAGNGELPGTWTAATQAAVTQLTTDLGLTPSSALAPKVFKFLLTMDAATLLPGGDPSIRDAQRALNRRYIGRRDFYIVPADGYFLRDTHRALMFAVQYELGLADGVANGNFGPTTKSYLAAQGNLSVGSTDTTKFFVHLFRLGIIVNGYPVGFSGTFDAALSTAVSQFQQFVALPVTGAANFQTWAALLVSTGDPDRAGTGADCITTLTSEKLAVLRAAGYEYFGRYLTNTPDFSPDKCLKRGEAERIIAAGGRIFPIFQTGGSEYEHFTNRRGKEVAEEASNAAWAYGFPENTVIYFAVDFDALPYQVEGGIMEYFEGIHERIGRTGRTYRVGIYGPRDVCRTIVAAGLAELSFVSDMSTGYAGNLGQPLPGSWAFDQVQTLTVGGAIEIDKNIVSGRDQGVQALVPSLSTDADPLIPAQYVDAFKEDVWREVFEHEDSLAQQGIMTENFNNTMARIDTHDAYITDLAAQLDVPKALVMTPMIWEGSVINIVDDVQDGRVRAYYNALELGLTPPPGSEPDSSTGCCQIKASTALRSINWAVANGVLASRTYDPDRWQDMWEIWQLLNTDEEWNIRAAAVTMMREAARAGQGGGASIAELRIMTPSQVMAMCTGYNYSWSDVGMGDEAMRYGRNRMNLYYAIARWHEIFRG